MQNYALNLGRIKGCLIVRDRECMNCFLRTGMEGMIVILFDFLVFCVFSFLSFHLVQLEPSRRFGWLHCSPQ